MKNKGWVFGLGIFLVLNVLAGDLYSQVKTKKERLKEKSITESVKAFKLSDEIQTLSLQFVGERDYVGIGLFNTFTGWFFVPRNILMAGDAKLVFYVSHSNILSPTSTVTAAINDKPIYSANLIPENASKTRVEVTIPQEMIQEKSNSVQFQCYAIQNVSRPCKDLDNPANWVVVHRDSYLDLTYKKKPLNVLELFPDPLINLEKFEKRKSKLAILLPENPTLEERNAALIMVQYLGYTAPFLYPGIETVLGQNIPKELIETANLISIGDIDRNAFSKQLKEVIPADKLKNMNEDYGIVAMLRSPSKEERVVVVISGKNDKVLPKAALTLSFPELVDKMEQSYAFIDSKQDLPKIKSIADISNPTFLDLGYYTTKLAGTFESVAEFSYAVPPHWQILPGAALYMDISYSPLLNPDKSILTLIINDKPIQSFKLAGGGGRARWKFDIPEELLTAKHFYVTIRTYLDVGEKDCESRYFDRAWVIIHDETYFHVPHTLIPFRGFEHFPSNFYGESGINDIRIVIPESPTVEEYNAAFGAAYILSSHMPYNVKPHFEILKTSEVTKEMLKKYDLILIGSILRNRLIKEINNKLPQPLDLDTGRPKKTAIQILPEFLSNVAILELCKSPWNEDRQIMVITSETNFLLKQAIEDLMERQISGLWYGDIIFINDKNQWHAPGETKKETEKKTFSRRYYALIFWILLVLAIIGVLTVISYRKHKYGFRDPFKD